MLLILSTLWFILPIGIANMMPVFAARLFPSADLPLDFGREFKKRPLFGSHKTWRGLAAAFIGGLLVFWIQQWLSSQFEFIKLISLFNYAQVPLIFGGILGLGAIFGDLLKSFFKRQMGIAPGDSWFPFDQIDWYVGGLFFTTIYYVPSWQIAVIGLALALLLSLLFKAIGFWFGIDKKKF